MCECVSAGLSVSAAAQSVSHPECLVYSMGCGRRRAILQMRSPLAEHAIPCQVFRQHAQLE